MSDMNNMKGFDNFYERLAMFKKEFIIDPNVEKKEITSNQFSKALANKIWAYDGLLIFILGVILTVSSYILPKDSVFASWGVIITCAILYLIGAFVAIIFSIKFIFNDYNVSEEDFKEGKKYFLRKNGIKAFIECVVIALFQFLFISIRISNGMVLLYAIIGTIFVVIACKMIFVFENLNIEFYHKDKKNPIAIIKNILLVLITGISIITCAAFCLSVINKFIKEDLTTTNDDSSDWIQKSFSGGSSNNNSFGDLSDEEYKEKFEKVNADNFNKVKLDFNSNTLKQVNLKLLRDYTKSEDSEKVALISKFTVDDSYDEFYYIKNLTDGILAYSIKENKGLIRKYNINGKCDWQISVTSNTKFYDVSEQKDTYFMLAKQDDKNIMMEISKNGSVIGYNSIDNSIKNLSFVVNEEKMQNNIVELVGTDSNQDIIILQCKDIKTSVTNIQTTISGLNPKKVVKYNNLYIGMASDISIEEESFDKKDVIDIFSYNIDTTNEEKHNVRDDKNFCKTVGSYAYIKDIATDGEKIYYVVHNCSGLDNSDVYIYDLTSTDIMTFGYSKNDKITEERPTTTIEGIVYSDDSFYLTFFEESDNIIDRVSKFNVFIDKVSKDYNLQERMEISKSTIYDSKETTNIKNGHDLLQSRFTAYDISGDNTITIYIYAFKSNT